MYEAQRGCVCARNARGTQIDLSGRAARKRSLPLDCSCSTLQFTASCPGASSCNQLCILLRRARCAAPPQPSRALLLERFRCRRARVSRLGRANNCAAPPTDDERFVGRHISAPSHQAMHFSSIQALQPWVRSAPPSDPVRTDFAPLRDSAAVNSPPISPPRATRFLHAP